MDDSGGVDGALQLYSVRSEDGGSKVEMMRLKWWLESFTCGAGDRSFVRSFVLSSVVLCVSADEV